MASIKGMASATPLVGGCDHKDRDGFREVAGTGMLFELAE
jgi:hypothetical protein